MPFLENVLRGQERAPRAAARGGRALPALRRREPDQRTEPRAARGPARELPRTGSTSRSTGATATGIRFWLTRCADGGRRRQARPGLRDLGLLHYSGCRQYREDIVRAGRKLAGGARVDKLRVYYNHPGFIAANGGPVGPRPSIVLPQRGAIRRRARFTAHSIPLAMARSCAYEAQLGEVAGLVASRRGRRSGPRLPEPQRPAAAALA